jgi:hypothetical protein
MVTKNGNMKNGKKNGIIKMVTSDGDIKNGNKKWQPKICNKKW